jgi:hypothetical protein
MADQANLSFENVNYIDVFAVEREAQRLRAQALRSMVVSAFRALRGVVAAPQRGARAA